MSVGARLLRNLGVLATGRFVNALLNLAAISSMARALPLAEFGTVVLIHMYALTVRGMVNAKPFLAIIRYGVPAVDKGANEELSALLRRCLRIDRISATLATVGAIALAPTVGKLMNWDAGTVQSAMAFSLLLCASGTGTANGVLRLFDRFDLIARQLSVGPFVRASGALIAWWQGAGMSVFISIWAIALFAEYATLIWLGRAEVRSRGLVLVASLDKGVHRWPDMRRFLAQAWVQTQLDMVPNRLATLIVGASLGAEAAGLFRVAKETASVLSKPTTLLRQVAFPDLTRLWESDVAQFRSLLLRITVAAFVIGLSFAGVALVAGEQILSIIFGPQFGVAAVLLCWLLLAAAFEFGGAALRPAGYAMAIPGAVLAIHIGATVVFVALAYGLMPGSGVEGLGVASSSMMGLNLLALAVVIALRSRPQSG